MQAINVSIGVDKRLWAQDLAGSRAHCRMLAQQGIIQQADAEAILGGLDVIEGEIRDGSFPFRDAYEDIHMNVEARLSELIGEPSGRLHTARSRNDQVATDFRLWVRDACDRTVHQVQALQRALVAKAEPHAATLMPGFTHLQPAQPVTFGHHLLAWFEMLSRDYERLVDCRKRVNRMPLGSAALAGTTYPIAREITAELLGFDQVGGNSLDGVSDRDGVELFGHTAGGFDLAGDQLAQVLQVHVAGHELGEAVRDGDDRLLEVTVLHAGGTPQGTGTGHVAAGGGGTGTILRHGGAPGRWVL